MRNQSTGRRRRALSGTESAEEAVRAAVHIASRGRCSCRRRCGGGDRRLWPAVSGRRPAATSPSSGPRAPGRAGAAAARRPRPAPVPPPSPSPTRELSALPAPRTIPAVREHTAARGPGWQPATAARSSSADPALADEAKLLAEELRIGYRGADAARAGDVELALPGAAGEGPRVVHPDRPRQPGHRSAAPAEAGVFYGTRTLKQAVTRGEHRPRGRRTRPADRPQRGLKLDIARKHFTADWIEDRLREMADLKLNQLGLHFSDDQGFRIESDTHPEVVSEEHLTKAEVRRIVELAASLHITVVPEIDSPGHLGAVLEAHPDLQLRNAQGVGRSGAIDISKPESAQIVDDLLKEYAELFPGAYWHLGADEYQALMVSDPEASYPQLAAAARRSTAPAPPSRTWRRAGSTTAPPSSAPTARRVPEAWNDGFFTGGSVQADKDIEVAYWTGKEIGARPPPDYLGEGRKVINLNDEFLYYVLGEPNDFVYPTGERIYEQWTPLVLRGTDAGARRVRRRRSSAAASRSGATSPNAQTQAQVAEGIRMPLRALSQKLWDPGQPRCPGRTSRRWRGSWAETGENRIGWTGGAGEPYLPRVLIAEREGLGRAAFGAFRSHGGFTMNWCALWEPCGGARRRAVPAA